VCINPRGVLLQFQNDTLPSFVRCTVLLSTFTLDCGCFQEGLSWYTIVRDSRTCFAKTMFLILFCITALRSVYRYKSLQSETTLLISLLLSPALLFDFLSNSPVQFKVHDSLRRTQQFATPKTKHARAFQSFASRKVLTPSSYPRSQSTLLPKQPSLLYPSQPPSPHSSLGH